MTENKFPVKKFVICRSLVAMYLSDAWTSACGFIVSPLPGVKKHKSKFSPCPALSQMKVRRMVLKTHWVKGKKRQFIYTNTSCLSCYTPAHNSMLLIEYQLSLHIVMRGGEGKVHWTSLKAQTICSPIFKHFFTILYLHLTWLGVCMLKYLTWSLELMFVPRNLFFFKGIARFEAKSSTSWQEEREITWVENLLLVSNLLKNTLCTETYLVSIWMCLVHMGWGKIRNSVHDQIYHSHHKVLNRNQIRLCLVQG